jgi:hypothetical protein
LEGGCPVKYTIMTVPASVLLNGFTPEPTRRLNKSLGNVDARQDASDQNGTDAQSKCQVKPLEKVRRRQKKT